jgi:hypothetical protein
LPQVGEDRPQVWENTNHGNKLNMVVKTKTCDEFTRVKTLNEEVAIFVGTELAPYVRACRRPPDRMTFPAEPHYKYILLNGEANTVQACGKPSMLGAGVS